MLGLGLRGFGGLVFWLCSMDHIGRKLGAYFDLNTEELAEKLVNPGFAFVATHAYGVVGSTYNYRRQSNAAGVRLCLCRRWRGANSLRTSWGSARKILKGVPPLFTLKFSVAGR